MFSRVSYYSMLVQRGAHCQAFKPTAVSLKAQLEGLGCQVWPQHSVRVLEA